MYNGFVKVATASPFIRVADTDGNSKIIINEYRKAREKGVKLIVFPELAVSSCSCGDLFRQRALIEGSLKAISDIKSATEGSDMLVVVGFPMKLSGKLYNCAAVISDGRVLGIVPKGKSCDITEFSDGPIVVYDIEFLGETVPFGKSIVFKCKENEDFAVGVEIGDELFATGSPSEDLALNGATVIVNLAASNELVGKAEQRQTAVKAQSSRLMCAYLYANCSDGESSTDKVYSGHSIISENGHVLAESELFEPETLITEIDLQRLTHDRMKSKTFVTDKICKTVCFSQKQENTSLTRKISKTPFVPISEIERKSRCDLILKMQASGLKKRIQHINCKSIVIGISGGLDSSLALLVMAKAMDALERKRSDIIAVTMPCFGTTKRTKTNAELLCEQLGVTFKEVDITKSVKQHFKDIGQDEELYDVTFENSQARERTQVLMDIANKNSGIVIGTGDLSELALGFATYNGDHMSMYGVNASVPKTLVRHLVRYYADTCQNETLSKTLYDILDTPVSPELIPPKDGEISQVTENIVGPYELHDFFLYYFCRFGFTPEKVYTLAVYTFKGEYSEEIIRRWLEIFCRRFITQQFKRSCMPDGPKVGTVSLSPRGDFNMPSDTATELWKI